MSTLTDQPDMTSDVMDGQTWDQVVSTFDTWNDAWTVFDQAMKAEVEAAPDPAIGKNEIARLKTALETAGAAYVSSIELFATENPDLIGETIDLMYAARDEVSALNALALQCVNALANDPADWAQILVTVQIDLATLIQRELGVVSESIVNAVMEANQPGYNIDPFMLPIGLQLSIPANIDEF
jgi:hypothetical protein